MDRDLIVDTIKNLETSVKYLQVLDEMVQGMQSLEGMHCYQPIWDADGDLFCDLCHQFITVHGEHQGHDSSCPLAPLNAYRKLEGEQS